MLRTVASQRIRGALPLSLLEFIFVSSTSPINRSYRSTRPPFPPNVEPSASADMLSRLSATLMRPDYEGRLTDEEAESHNRHLSALRLALASEDLLHIRDVFCNPEEHLVVAALTARDLETISKMLQKHFSVCKKDQDVMDGARAMAIKVAAKGQFHGLQAYLLLHLKNGDVAGVSSAYDEYAVMSQQALISAPEQIAPSDALEDTENTSFDMLISEPVERRPTNIGAADLLLTAITAYATEDRYDDAFDRFLASPMTIRVTKLRVSAFCSAYLGHDSEMTRKLHSWTQKLVILRLVSRHSSLHNYVTSLADNKRVVALQKLYSTIISHCQHIDGRLVVSDAAPDDHRKGRRSVIVSNDTWSILIRAFFKCSRTDLVETLWNEVVSLGVSPSRHMWTTLLDGYGRHGQCDQAMSVWNRMLGAGVEPNEHSYGAMINAYFSARRRDEGFALFEQFRIRVGKTTVGKQSLHDPFMLPLYNIVLHGLCTNAMDGQARNIMREMIEHGPNPDIVSYNIFLRHYGRIGDMKSLGAVLRGLGPANIQPDVHSFTTVLSALYKGGKRDAHMRMIKIMETMGVKPNVAMYSAIIDFLVRQGGKENFRNAGSLLQLMENNSDKGSRPNEVTYTGILAGLHRDPTMSMEDIKLHAADLFSRMHKNGTLPNRTTYHYLIKACLENPGAQGLQMGLGYYREMWKRGFTLTNRTWYVILSSLLRRGDWAIAGEVMGDMFRKGHKPDNALATLVQRVQQEITQKGGHV